MGLGLPAIIAIGTGVESLGRLSQASYQARVAKNNAEVAEMNARRSIEESRLTSQQQDEAGLAELGRTRAAAGASGLTGGSINLRMDAINRLLGRDRRATEYAGVSEATNFLNRAADFRGEAKAARTSGLFSFGTSLLGGLEANERLKRFGVEE